MDFTIYVRYQNDCGNFDVCCCFHYIVASMGTSFEITTQQCVLSHQIFDCQNEFHEAKSGVP